MANEKPHTFADSLVKIFLRSGHVFAGIVKEWDEENGVILVNINGDETRIPFIKDICAVTLKFNKDGKLVKAKRNIDNNIPESIKADPESLLAVQKIKANQELENFIDIAAGKEEIANPEVVHGSQLSVVRSFKNNPKI